MKQGGAGRLTVSWGNGDFCDGVAICLCDWASPILKVDLDSARNCRIASFKDSES
jgi:hypothetical protein